MFITVWTAAMVHIFTNIKIHSNFSLIMQGRYYTTYVCMSRNLMSKLKLFIIWNAETMFY